MGDSADARKRVPIPSSTQTKVLLANRHACCVCQTPRVQLHHIDGDPSNNEPGNIAALCTDHHDMASMTLGLTKKIQPAQVKHYKSTWEAQCAAAITALARERFTFYYCIYKNPPRILTAYISLSSDERQAAVKRLHARMPLEQDRKTDDPIFGINAVPQEDAHTAQALRSVYNGEKYPSYLGKFLPHPDDPNYSTDSSSPEAMYSYHRYDLWCQVVAQCLAEARGAMPLEDLLNYADQDVLDRFAGSLISFKLSVRGKGIKTPRLWKEHPTSSIAGNVRNGKATGRAKMHLRTMYLFSDTAAENLRNGRVSGLGILQGVITNGAARQDITIVPLIIGAGGWNLHPELA